LADDHALVRDGIGYLLKGINENNIILESATLDEVVCIIKDNNDIDLLLLDLVMPGMDGVSSITHLRKISPNLPIAILSFTEDERIVRQALNLGANGFIPKSTSRDEIIRAIDVISTGEIYMPEALSRYSSQHDDTREMNKNHFNLTPRQKEVLIMIAEGATNKEVGRKLNLSEATVRNHASAIFKILKTSNRTQAVRIAKEYGLLY